MKTTVIALLAATAEAQPADGTAVIDCGNCDEAAYAFYDAYYWASGSSCWTDSTCSGTDRCAILEVGGHGEAQMDGYCQEESVCEGDGFEDTAIADSTLTYSIFCNDATTDATGETFDDIADYVYWRHWVWSGDSGEVMVACTTSADCTHDGYACGDLSLGNELSGNYCMAMDSWCSSCDDTSNCDHSLSWDIPNSGNYFYTDCTADNWFNNWAWLKDDVYYQDGTCDSSLEDWTESDECTVGWTCGTLTADGGSEEFETIGCYDDADCETLGANVPGTGDDDTYMFVLACGATQFVASAVAAVAVAASI